MGTHSRIGILYKNGTVKAVYCDWDGYPKWVGSKLLKFYNSVKKAEALISKGDLSSLKDSPEDSVYCAGVAVNYPSFQDYKNVGEEYQYWFNEETNPWYYCAHSGAAHSLQEYFGNTL